MKELKKLQNALKNVHLSKEEKAEGRAAFTAFMQDNPLPGKANPGFFSSFYLRLRRPVLASAMAFGVLVVTTGGVTYASESALPGDFLYPFKVDVVEEVRGAFQFNAEEKATWDAERMQRRFEEAEQLKDEGKLNPEFKVQIKEKMEEHKKEFKDHLEELKDKGKPDRADEMEVEFKFIFEQQEELEEEWKPDFEFRPLLEGSQEEPEEKTETELEVEVEVEVEAEVEIEKELELEVELEEEENEDEDDANDPEEESELKEEFELKIEDGIKID